MISYLQMGNSMRLGFYRMSALSASLCFALAIVWGGFPQLLLAMWAVDFSEPVGLVARRGAALFAGIGVMLFRLRHAGPSPARAAAAAGFVTGCALLALLGIGELAAGHAGPGILLAVAVELALAAGFLATAFGPMSFGAIFRGASASAGPALGPVAATLARPDGVRRYLVAAQEAAPGRPRPLVIVLHGGGASARQVMGQAFPPSPLSVWLEIAARDDLVVIAPDAGNGGWNDSVMARKRAAGNDDTGFIGALIDHAVGAHGADPERVYLIGVSHGGFMAYRAALEMPHRLAAFCAVLAGMPLPERTPARPAPLSALIVGATADPLVRWRGGRHPYAPPFMRGMRGVEATAAFWRTLAGLPDAPDTVRFPGRHADDPTAVTRLLWGADPRGPQVGLVRIDGGGHAEPSALKRYPRFVNWLTGRQNGDVETAELAWEFFRTKRASPSLHVDERDRAA